jgi:hypothetical protein
VVRVIEGGKTEQKRRGRSKDGRIDEGVGWRVYVGGLR